MSRPIEPEERGASGTRHRSEDEPSAVGHLDVEHTAVIDRAGPARRSSAPGPPVPEPAAGHGGGSWFQPPDRPDRDVTGRAPAAGPRRVPATEPADATELIPRTGPAARAGQQERPGRADRAQPTTAGDPRARGHDRAQPSVRRPGPPDWPGRPDRRAAQAGADQTQRLAWPARTDRAADAGRPPADAASGVEAGAGVQASAVVEADPAAGAGAALTDGRPARPVDSRRATARWLPLVLGLVLWGVGLASTDVDRLGDYGLLTVLPPAWYGGVGLVLVGAVLALGAPHASSRQLAAYGVTLVIVLFATIPAFSEAPPYAYLYKHVGVTRYIALHGTVDPSVDIYHRWPGFFAAAASFGALGGEDNPVAYAAWAEPFFALLLLLLVYALARALVGGRRVPWLAAYLFTAANWIGQTYFAPQAVGISLGLALYVVMIGQLTSPPSAGLVRLLERVGGRRGGVPPPAGGRLLGERAGERADGGMGGGVDEDGDGGVMMPGWPRAASVLVCLLCYAAVVGTHQLSPYLILLAVGVLTALGMVRPRWLLLALAAIAAAYLVPNASFVNEHFGLLSGLDPLANATDNGEVSDAGAVKSGARLLYARAGLLLVVLTFLAAFGASLVNLRRGRLRAAVIPVAVMAASSLIFFGQTYGGEGRLRVYLFSLPWGAIALASVLLPERGLASAVVKARHKLTAGVVLAVTAALWMCAFYIPYATGRLTRDEVAAAEWLYDNADPRLQIIVGDSDFPSNLSPGYPPFTSWFPVPFSLLEDSEYRRNSLYKGQQTEVAGIVELIKELGGDGYVVFSRSMRTYADLTGLVRPGTMARIEAGVAADPRFEPIYENPNATIYLFRGGSRGTATGAG
ncbi:hypothetical protein I6A81_20730 [Frankia sp. CN7]|uniref:Uncharacterized protein n=2 Tax=Frankia nepalensis TaxID=1836974 RepID=A0A937RKG1_9ACTN|nr:hypothetical protein [Frankia nepalensis]MBL7498624.1 hypothetical protein [Frankia nepalensis]MBL7630499.1 hypothetical protein [Frankia nepalensis]